MKWLQDYITWKKTSWRDNLHGYAEDRQNNEGGAGPQNYGEDTSGTIKITPPSVYYYDYSKWSHKAFVAISRDCFYWINLKLTSIH